MEGFLSFFLPFQQREIKMMRGLENMMYGERLEKLELFSVEKRRLIKNLISCQIQRGLLPLKCIMSQGM